MKAHDEFDKRQDSRIDDLTEYIKKDRYSLKGMDWGTKILNETEDINEALRIARHDFAELLERHRIIL